MFSKVLFQLSFLNCYTLTCIICMMQKQYIITTECIICFITLVSNYTHIYMQNNTKKINSQLGLEMCRVCSSVNS